ncbi:phospholipid-translocating P-type ATPase [Drepanopeziza brunnea f. sp. 'multigermtubi' MB_m1]|uniref:Phospholipid-transporting ATPase n=1 Tax=Marssonina brunnea f. sp. multigermtubi (strain MB_m1) TaxID=1072389 RepID=K1WTI4_MARBU|nr:phospholipid-translocating P-type ATPase [Drepanopeziza brunnea f. sp. 'multigermtubi' MB_m1]EKD16376.1 phospholipid-translocating P-type ATPase [Drepanopeziza brunnea f. sp. 'multigermtubi' MB_m1]
MSSSAYQQPNAPDSPADDSDSDLDLDLQELDPITTASPSSRKDHPKEERRTGHIPIPLRNLRMSGLRGAGKRNRGYGDLGRDRDANTEDLHGLLNESPDLDGANRLSAGSSRSAEDDAPLLPGPKGSHRRQPSLDALNKLGSHIRLPSFLSNAGSQSPPENNDTEEEEHDPASSRTVFVGTAQSARFTPNAISNAKYTPISFLPRTLYNEFSFFFNMYFLLVALSQAIPALRIGYLSTYIVPLVFVMSITLGKEALDDIGRRKRDAEANSEGYTVLCFDEPGVGNKDRYRAKKSKKANLKSRGRSLVERDRLSDIQEEEENGEGPRDRHLPSSEVREVIKKSRDLKVGDVLKMGKDQRLPADVVILKSFMNEAVVVEDGLPAAPESLLVSPVSDPAIEQTSATTADARESTSELGNTPSADAGGVGETFIRTDQLDGETDWKLRLGSPLTQSLDPAEFVRLRVVASKPDRKVNEFIGTVQLLPKDRGGYDPYLPRSSPMGNEIVNSTSAPLTIDNTAWCNTVLASNATTLAVVVYTGRETRSALSTSQSRSKTGLLEYEINSLTKILCGLTLSLSIILVALEGFEHVDGVKWYVKIMRFLVLFSTIVPISLRVNLDMGKSVYSRFIQRDAGIEGAVVRTSTIPEELGRIEYLLSDKTGTLTQNEMEMKKIHVGTVSYANEAMDEVTAYIKQGFSVPVSADPNNPALLITPSSTFMASTTATATRTRREIGSRVRDVVLALAICHSVTPTVEEDEAGEQFTSYQASSPDEIAIVKWTEMVGLRLIHRDRKGMLLQSVDTGRPVVRVRILEAFPFTSEGKRMGIIVQFMDGSEKPGNVDPEAGEIWFYQKGADTVMTSIVAANDWLDEETGNMAREGLRTLVVGRKRLSVQQYKEFATNFRDASVAINGRDAGMARVVAHYLERDLELLGVTGVEDKLQKDVKPSLELLRNAGIKIWMLTGDKVETARCVAVSAKLVARGQYIHTITKLKRKDNAQDQLDFLRGKTDSALLIDGESISLLLTHFRTDFISIAVLLPAVIACRCSPTQKADIAHLIRDFTKKRICCIGDGGNDVSMIQAADVGVGIVGKEGRQASLAADFSITQFCHLTKLLVWHGRNSYKRSAKLAQFVIHRGLIISVCQTMYSIAIKFEPEGLYKDWLLVGYATLYTMAPVFSLVLDKDVDENLANLYPELYKELTTGSSLSYRTFFVWVFVSIYQGGMIQGLSQILTEVDGPRMVSVSFTVLIVNELCMVAFEITTWHPIMIACLVGTALLYLGSIPFLGGYFDLGFIVTLGFVWRVLAISAISLIPPYAGKLIRRAIKPPSYRKVQGI